MARIAGVNIPQNKLVHIGLTYIYGIGNKFSNQICTSLEIPTTFAPSAVNHIDNQLPLKPVCPVITTVLFLKALEYIFLLIQFSNYFNIMVY